MNEEVYFDEIAQSLAHAVYRGDASLNTVPGLLRLILEQDMWRRRVSSVSGQIIEFSSFLDFVVALPPEGLGTSIQKLKCLCGYEPEWFDTLDQLSRDEEARIPKSKRIQVQPDTKRVRIMKDGERVINPARVSDTAKKLKRYMSQKQIDNLIKRLQE